MKKPQVVFMYKCVDKLCCFFVSFLYKYINTCILRADVELKLVP